jgi:fibronectin-binding autotransporter adhesin
MKTKTTQENRRGDFLKRFASCALMAVGLLLIETVCPAATLNNYFNFVNIGTTNSGGATTISDYFGTNATVKTTGTTLNNSAGLVIAAGNNGGTTGVQLPASAISGFTGDFTVQIWYTTPAAIVNNSMVFGGTTTASQDGNMSGDQAFFAGYAGANPNYIRPILGNNTQYGAAMTTPNGVGGTVNTLYDYVVTYIASSHTFTAYTNGTQVGTPVSVTYFNGLFALTNGIAIGGVQTPAFGDPAAAVTVSDFLIYNGALSAAQAGAVHTLGVGASVSSIQAALVPPTAFTWNGGGGDNNWNTGVNWVGGTAPGISAGNDLTFAGSIRTTPNMSAAYSIGNVTFSNNASAFTVGTSSGNTLTLAGGVTNNSANVQTLNTPIALSGAVNFNAAAGDLILNSNVFGSTLTKTGNGTLTLAGVNTFGPLAVSSGKLTITGSASPGSATVGNAAGNAVLNLSGSLTAGNLFVGNAASATGAVYQTAGTVTLSGGGGDMLNLGNWDNTFGYYNAAGGTLNVNGISIGGAKNTSSGAPWPPAGASADGIFEVNGATVNDSGWITLARGGGPNTGILNVFSGSLTYAGGGIGANWQTSGQNQTSIINILGGSVTTTANVGISFRSTDTGVLNLNGGLINGNGVSGAGVVNFNGGTLQATTNSASFLSVSSAYVYGGGAIIDNNGKNITIPQQLLTPAGYGVSSITLSSGGSGYIAPPVVALSGGSGSGATAIAQIDRNVGAVTNIIVTGAGVNYQSGDTLTVDFSGGGGTGAVANTPVLAANTSGGLTSNGNGTLTLSGGYAYTGPTIVRAGTLNLDAAQSSSSSSVLTVSNATLALSLNNGNSSITAGGVSLAGTNALNLNFGTATSPGAYAINAGGNTVTIAGKTTVNITGANLVVGQYPIIYTGGSVPTNHFVLGSVPVGMAAVLVDSGTSLDLQVTGTGQNLIWYGADNLGNPLTTWDINTSSDWNSGNAKYLQYAGNSYGDYVTFDDTLFSPSSADITLNATVVPASVNFNNNSTPYSIAGSGGIGGTTSLVKSGGASVYLGTSNSYTGGTIVNAGTLSVASDSALGISNGVVTLNGATLQFSNTTASVRSLTVTTNSTLDVAPAANAQLAGVISGAAGLTKTGNGTLTLSATNTYAGKTIADGGTLSVTGGQTVSPTLAGPGLIVGNTQNASLNVSGGTVVGNTSDGEFGSGLVVGNASGIAGSVTVSGSGNVTSGRQLALGNATGSYGAWNQTGGTGGTGTNTGGFLVVGFGGASGVFNQSGGTFTIGRNATTIAAGDSGSIGVMNVSGGTFNSMATAGSYGTAGGLTVGEIGAGTLNVSGSASVNLSGNWNLSLGKNTGASGTVNLLGGTLGTPQVSHGSGSSIFNFNGGTLLASATNANFMTGLTVACVYSGGAVINDGGNQITIAQPLLAPNDYGVSSISLSAGGSGYIAPPVVTISGGSGSNATVIAQISAAGAVTNIMVSSPGTGYQSSDLLAVTFTGGGGSGATANAPVLVANTSGGLTKTGNGTLTLAGINTYTSPTVVIAGTLAGTGTISGALTNNATLAPGTDGTGALTVNGNLTLKPGSTNLFSVNGTTPANTSVVAGGNVTYGGVLKIATNGTFTAGQQFPLFSGVGAASASSFASISGNPGSGLAFSFTNGVLSVVTTGPTGPGVITNSISGSALTLTWPAGQGWRLEGQTNSLSTGLSPTGWSTVSGASDGSVIITTDLAKPTVFYRLVYP